MRDRSLERRTRAGWLAVLVAGAVLTTSCGDDGGRSTAATSTSTPTRSPANVLDDLREESGSPGILALVRDGDGEWFGTSGSADLDGTPIEASTRFRIGSITKTLTAALVLDAVERGELELDDTIQSWVPGAVSDGRAITIQMLLAHTSGVFNAGDEGDIATDIGRISDPGLRQEAQDVGARYLAGEAVIAPAEVLVAVADTHPLYFAPGAGHHYSNVNYQLLAMVLEKATGKDFATLLEQRLTGPLKLSSTTTAPADLRPPDLRSYTKDPDTGELVDTTTDLLGVGNGGSGGVVTTAGELLDLLQAVVAGDVLPPGLRTEMATPTKQSAGSYGLGLATYDLACGDYLGHGGAIAGTHTLGLVSPDGTTGLILAANLRGDPEPDLLGTAEELLCGDP